MYLGPDSNHPESLPAQLGPTIPRSSPMLDGPFVAPQPGFYVLRHAGDDASRKPSRVEPLDAETIKQLKSLGYLQ